MSSFAAAVGAGAMRRGERDPTLDGELGTQTVADARWTARARTHHLASSSCCLQSCCIFLMFSLGIGLRFLLSSKSGK